eukprot:10228869-Alexandrium_andersonii.AAC.1
MLAVCACACVLVCARWPLWAFGAACERGWLLCAFAGPCLQHARTFATHVCARARAHSLHAHELQYGVWFGLRK